MPISKRYLKTFRNMQKQYCGGSYDKTIQGVPSCKKGRSVFYAWANKNKIDYKGLSDNVILSMIGNNVEKYNDEDIEMFHALGHMLMKNVGDTGCRLHYSIAKEMGRRGLIHIVRSICDEVVADFSKREGEIISLDEVLNIFRSTDIIKLSSKPGIYLSGELVEEGKIGEGSNIDVLFTGPPNPDIVVAYKKNLPEQLFNKLNFIWNSKEVKVDSSVPLYIQSLIPVKKELVKKELKDKELELNKQYITLRPQNTYSNIMESWIEWGGDHIDNGIVVQEKLQGNPLQIHIQDKNNVVGLADLGKIQEEFNSLNIDSGLLEGNIISFKEGKIKGVNARGVRESGVVSDSGTNVLVLTDILHLNGRDLSRDSVKDRISILGELIPKDLKSIDIIKGELTKSYKDYFSSVRKHSKARGSTGTILKDASSIYCVKYTGDNKTTEWINVVDDGSDILMELEENIEVEFDQCKYHNTEVCLQSPDKCSLSKYYRCMYT